VSLKDLHTSISEEDERILMLWQERLKGLTKQKLTLGEVAGLLARVCESRYEGIPMKGKEKSLDQLVMALIGESAQEKR
jgi:hypothetical protein